jgi:hypothetical protein
MAPFPARPLDTEGKHMARGFESKSVADQQAEAENRRTSRPAPVPERVMGPRRRGLELARADALHRIEQSTDERYRAMLRKAVADLDAQIGALS